MKQISLFDDDGLKGAEPNKEPVKMLEPERELPSDLDLKYEEEEKSLEENYVRENFIFEEPEPTSLVQPDPKGKAPKPPKNVLAATPKKGRGRMKLSDMEEEAEQIAIPDDEALFKKRYYSIGAVAQMFNVNISLLRYWENEFDVLKPKKNGKGDRHFRPEDIKNIQLIYHLLREKKYTLQGAKDFLKKTKDSDKHFEVIESLKNLKSFLLELKSTI